MDMEISSLLQKYKNKIKFIGAQNSKIAQIKQILRNAGDEKLFVMEGIWAHERALLTKIMVDSFLFCPDYIYSRETLQLVEKFINGSQEVYAVSKKVLTKLSERDGPDGLLSIGIFPDYRSDTLRLKEEAVIIVLDGLETPGNIGTILRTCDGAGVDAVLICNKKARITHPKLIKGSMGAVFSVPIIEFDSVDACQKWLEDRNFTIYLADPGADQSYSGFDYGGNIALILGNERYGISKVWYENGAQRLSIPMSGICDSLNVGVAASIITYEISVKKKMEIKHGKHLV